MILEKAGNPVIAELGTGHNGRLENALRLIRESAAAGADVVKFQCYKVRELLMLRHVAPDDPVPEPWNQYALTMAGLYGLARTPHAWFPEMVAECERVGVPWFSSVFGLESLELLQKLDCPAFKVARLDTDTNFRRVLCNSTDRPIVTSHALDSQDWAALTLYCPPGYPQDWSQQFYYTHFDGVSYHGTDVSVPRWLRKEGVGMIEVHVQLDDEPSELDAHSSLTVTQLKELCS